jgi:hypothetical protein
VLLVKEEDNAEASASPNWIMKKDIGEIQVPQPPEGWMPSMPDGKRGEPTFEIINNSGDWPEYMFKAKFKSSRSGSPIDITPYLYEQNLSLQMLKETSH